MVQLKTQSNQPSEIVSCQSLNQFFTTSVSALFLMESTTYLHQRKKFFTIH
jgi:hypothetical protein